VLSINKNGFESLNVKIYSQEGKIVYSSIIEHPGGFSSHTIVLPSKIPPSVYHFSVTGNNGLIKNIKIFLMH